MRALETITQIFDRCAAARVKASLVLCIAALIFCPLSAHAETASLQYDNNGNITQRTTPLGTTTYTYDPLGRLTSEAGPAKTQTFTYDENGNRLSDGAGSYTYEPVSNRMSTRLGLAVTHDAAGRLTADGTGRTFAYNQAGQLYQVRQGGTLIATYYYDGNGLRTRKVTTASAPQGAQTVIYGYDEQGHLIAELSGTDAPIRSYFWQGDIPLAQMEHQAGDKILYFVTDHLNTPRAAMDETGKVVWRWESDAFGSTLPNEDTDSDGNLTTVNLRFPGQYYDVESGLHYNGHRYYSPLLKIFTQTDRLDLLRQAVNPLYAEYSEPTDLQRALNQPYAYAGNDPMSEIDPLGLMGSGVGSLPPYSNGNYEPGFKQQDAICTLPGKLGKAANSNACVLSCCVAHDACYTKNRCNASSWRGNTSGTNRPGACQQCNAVAASCIAKSLVNSCLSCNK